MGDYEIKIIEIEKPDELNFILGHSHFIKTVEDLYEVMVNSVPNAKFGIAFCEASADRKIRSEGNDKDMITLAERNAKNIAAGHTFIIFMKDCFPLNVLNSVKQVPEVCRIYCATANPTKIVIIQSSIKDEEGRGILGVIDGFSPVGVENNKEKNWRKEFLRKIKYKL